MVNERFAALLATRYPLLRAQHPTDGRRKLRLRTLYQSWPTLVSGEHLETVAPALETDDSDPFDSVLEDEELGLIIRTDFTNDTAWSAFCDRVMAAQGELLSEISQNSTEPAAPISDSSVAMQDASSESAQDDVEEDDLDDIPDIVKIYDPSDPMVRSLLSNISNLDLLRLFNDVDIRPAPTPPAGQARLKVAHPLIDSHGWQEIYTGKNIWVYDSRSNNDQCVRVVRQTSDFYGTATGDSWRARGSHIPELQFNMSHQGMEITFNGIDRYDVGERNRNLEEAPKGLL